MAPVIKAVFIDMDNTLLRTQQLYEDAHAELAAFIGAKTGIPADVVIAETRRREIGLFPVHGYGREMLPSAFAETLLHYAPAATPAEITAVRDIAYTVFCREAVVKEDAEQAIRTLAAHVPDYLLTAGDEEVQRSRVAKLAFLGSFREIYIVPEKDAAVYTSLLAKHRLNPAETVMIGDSLKSDIVASVEAGMNAIYIPDMNWTAREQAGQAFPAERAVQLKDLTEAVALLLPQIVTTPEIKQIQKRRSGGPAP